MAQTSPPSAPPLSDDLHNIAEDQTLAAPARVFGASATGEAEALAQTRLAGAERRSGPPPAPVAGGVEPDRGTSVGRYLVVKKVGEGAMGVVFAAHDPELDRMVAIKLLHGANRGGDAQARLLREAQVLARLNHNNVVAVHDIGVHGESVFIAMEFVSGDTLHHWAAVHLREEGTPPPWQEVTRVFEAAGRGLAAAHHEGLIHRDFKPANVMIGDDGRVRVMDFGLARAALDRPHEADEPLRPPGDVEELGETLAQSSGEGQLATLTHHGALIGTPAYMAPEQFTGARVTAHTDQFSFCTAFYEILYGERPFSGESIAELAAAIRRGRIPDPPKRTTIPGWLRRVLQRGLEVDPSRRYPSMGALLSAIEQGRARRRRRQVAAPLLALAVVSAGIVGLRQHDATQRERACQLEGEAIGEIWDEEIAESVRSSILATGAPYAGAVAAKVVPALDQHTLEWSARATEACQAARVEGRWPSPAYDKAAWCLDHARSELVSLIDHLGAADTVSVQEALPSVIALSKPEACVDEGRLASLGDPPPHARRPAVAALYAQIYQARRRATSGDYSGALADILRVRDVADTVGWEPLRAATRAAQAHLYHLNGDYDIAERTGREAFKSALRARSWTVSFAVSAELAEVVGVRQDRHREGLLWADLADTLRVLAGDPTGMLAADLSLIRGHIDLKAGDFANAASRYREALELEETIHGADHPLLAGPLNALGSALSSLGKYNEALELHERSLVLRRGGLAEDHPAVGDSLVAMGSVLRELGALEEARTRYQEALLLYRGALGPRHPQLVETLNALADLALRRDATDQAEQYLEEALAIAVTLRGDDRVELANTYINLGLLARTRSEYTAARNYYESALAVYHALYGDDSLAVSNLYNNLGSVDYFQGDMVSAKLLFQRAFSIRERLLGPDHPELSTILNNLGKVSERLGASEEARANYERALEIAQSGVGEESPALASFLFNLASVEATLGRAEEAIRYYERADAALSGPDGAARLRTRTRFQLAKLLWSTPVDGGRDRDRAMLLARSAYEGSSEASEASDAADAEEIASWIAERSER